MKLLFSVTVPGHLNSVTFFEFPGQCEPLQNSVYKAKR